MPESRRNPFEGVTDFVSELSRMRTLGVHGSSEHSAEQAERTHASAWVPVTDIFAAGDNLVIQVELAGVEPQDVDLRFAHGVLTVSGSRTLDPAVEGQFYIRERYHGEFRRLITLPDGTEPEQIVAEFGDGLVEITVKGGVSDSGSTKIEVTNRSGAKTSRGVEAGDV